MHGINAFVPLKPVWGKTEQRKICNIHPKAIFDEDEYFLHSPHILLLHIWCLNYLLGLDGNMHNDSINIIPLTPKKIKASTIKNLKSIVSQIHFYLSFCTFLEKYQHFHRTGNKGSHYLSISQASERSYWDWPIDSCVYYCTLIFFSMILQWVLLLSGLGKQINCLNYIFIIDWNINDPVF